MSNNNGTPVSPAGASLFNLPRREKQRRLQLQQLLQQLPDLHKAPHHAGLQLSALDLSLSIQHFALESTPPIVHPEVSDELQPAPAERPLDLSGGGFKQGEKSSRNNAPPWLPEEWDWLRAVAQLGKSAAWIAQQLERTLTSVYCAVAQR